MVGSGGQRVITIVTDGVPLSNLQAAIPTSGINQPFIVTMQDGQQGKTLLGLENFKPILGFFLRKEKETTCSHKHTRTVVCV